MTCCSINSFLVADLKGNLLRGKNDLMQSTGFSSDRSSPVDPPRTIVSFLSWRRVILCWRLFFVFSVRTIGLLQRTNCPRNMWIFAHSSLGNIIGNYISTCNLPCITERSFLIEVNNQREIALFANRINHGLSPGPHSRRLIPEIDFCFSG